MGKAADLTIGVFTGGLADSGGLTSAGEIVGDIATGGAISQRKAAKAQAAAQRTQQRIADIKASRERRKQVAQARQARAQIESQAGAAGIAGSSGAIGAESSVQSQLGSNLSFLDQVQSLSQQTSIFNQQAAKAQSNAATAGAIRDTAAMFIKGS